MYTVAQTLNSVILVLPYYRFALATLIAGRVPIEPKLAECMEFGDNFVEKFSQSAAAVAFKDIVTKLAS